MADPGRLRASLTVLGEDVDPDEVSTLLGTRPDRFHHVGDLVSNHSQTRRRTGLWSISSDHLVSEGAPLGKHIASLLGRVTVDLAVWSALASRHHVRVFVGWFMAGENEGAGIDPVLLGELSRRALVLDFDVYAPHVREDLESAPPAVQGH